jgi:hypothetical protein
MQKLLSQGCIEQMREPDGRFLQALPDDRGVRQDISRVDLHFPRCGVTGRALSNVFGAALVLGAFANDQADSRSSGRVPMHPAG